MAGDIGSVNIKVRSGGKVSTVAALFSHLRSPGLANLSLPVSSLALAELRQGDLLWVETSSAATQVYNTITVSILRVQWILENWNSLSRHCGVG